MKHTAIYTRVSTKAQDTASQEHELAAWRSAHPDMGPFVAYSDAATGKNMDRPGWQSLWAGVESGDVTRIIIWRLDRLGRTASGLTAVFDALVERKVGLVSLRDGLDLSTPAGRLIANVMASVAAYETEIRSERINAGIAAKKARGEKWGGWKKGVPRRLTLQKVRHIKRLVDKGNLAKAEIARIVELPESTVRIAIKEQRWNCMTGRGRIRSRTEHDVA